MIEQRELDAVVGDEAAKIAPKYLGGHDTAEIRRRMGQEISHAVGLRISQPFDVEIVGPWSAPRVRAVPRMTPAEIAEREAALEAIFAGIRRDEIEADKRRAADHPNRAAVTVVDGDAAISIAGMIEDLRFWRVPPECMNEESTGFARAIDDVVRYLRTRERLGK